MTNWIGKRKRSKGKTVVGRRSHVYVEWMSLFLALLTIVQNAYKKVQHKLQVMESTTSHSLSSTIYRTPLKKEQTSTDVYISTKNISRKMYNAEQKHVKFAVDRLKTICGFTSVFTKLVPALILLQFPQFNFSIESERFVIS